MKYKIIIIPLLFLCIPIVSAQNIRQQQQRQQYEQEQKRRQQEYEQERKATELKEAARLQKAQFSLQELINLSDIEERSTVEKKLKEKGYSLNETYTSDESENVSFGFDIDMNNKAKYWFHWYHSYKNQHNPYWITYQFVDEALFNKYENSLLSNSFKKIESAIIDNNNNNIQNIYKNDRYKVTVQKRFIETDKKVGYKITVLNYKKEEEIEEKAFAAYKQRVQKSHFTVKELLLLSSEKNKVAICQMITDKELTVLPFWHEPSYQTNWIKNIEDSLMYTTNLIQFSARFPSDEKYFETNLCVSESPSVFLSETDTLLDNGVLFNSMNIEGDNPIQDIIASGFQKISSDIIKVEDADTILCSTQRIVEKYHYEDFEMIIAYNHCDYPDDCLFFEGFLYNYRQAYTRRKAIEKKIHEFYDANNQLKHLVDTINAQLLAYPYNYLKHTLHFVDTLPISLLENSEELAIELYAKKEALFELFEHIKTESYTETRNKFPQHFTEIWYNQNPQQKRLADSAYVECRCKFIGRLSFDMAWIDNTVTDCNCRESKYQQVSYWYNSREEFDREYSQTESEFEHTLAERKKMLDDVRQLESILDSQKQVNLKKALTSSKPELQDIIKRVERHENSYYYNKVMNIIYAYDERLSKEWTKNGSYFKSKDEMYDFWIGEDYDKVLKARKKK